MRMSDREAREWRALDARYIRETGCVAHQVRDVVVWAESRGIAMPRTSVDYRIARLSAALQADVSRDADGRLVRNQLPRIVVVKDSGGKLTQQVLWAPFEQASHEHLRHSALQRRAAIKKDVERLRADIARLNERDVERGSKPVQMHFNFDVVFNEDA